MKKVLSIVLSIVMVLCMMPAMAFASTSAVFTDEADIQHDAAVGTLVALGVFEGYPDGSFQPAKVVTRAEMAKTIATVLNGGEAPVLSASTTSYNDTKGHWAAPYIEYCTSLGIVEGFNGAFSPDAPVTAEAAAKMILVAQGYNAAVEGMTGGQWASNTNVLANQNDYYNELKDIKTDEGCTREHVAQMLNNALTAVVIEKTNSVNKVTGEVVTTYGPGTNPQTMAAKYFGYAEIVDVLSNVAYDADTKEYTYTLTSKGTFVSKVDYSSLFGQNVKVLYTDKTNGADIATTDVVYGVFAEKSSVVYEGLYGDVATVLSADGKSVAIDGTDYKVNPVNNGYALNNIAKVAAFDGSAIGGATLLAYSPIKVIDDGNDGDIDTIVWTPVKYTSVSFVGTTTFGITGVINSSKLDAADCVLYSGMAKDDQVAVVENAMGQKIVTKLDTMKNVKVTATKGNIATISDTPYKTVVDVNAGSSYDVTLLNGYIVAATGVASTFDISKYAIVTTGTVLEAESFDGTTYTTRVLLTDGTVNDTLKLDVNSKNFPANVDQGVIVTMADTDANGKTELAPANTVTANGTTIKYTLTKSSGTVQNPLAFVAKNATTGAEATLAGSTIADDAVIYVETTNQTTNAKTYSIMTGAELKTKNQVTAVEAYALTNATTGYAEIVLAKVTATDTTSTKYAVVEKVTEITALENSKYNYVIKAYTGDLAINGVVQNNLVEGLQPGKIISYTLKGNGEVDPTSVTVINGSLTSDSVAKYDGTKIEFTNGGEYKVADLTFIHIDKTATNKVYEGSTISLGEYVRVYSVNNVIDLVIFDINNAYVN